MAESTGYESGDPRYGEVPFGTVTEYDPSMDDDSPPLRPGDMVSINARGEAERAQPVRVIGPVTDATGNTLDAIAATIGVRRREPEPISVRFDMSRPFGGYRVGDRITLADGLQATITDVGPDGVYTAQLDGVMPESVMGTIGQSSRDPDNRRLRERAPQEMAFARNFFLAVKDAWREELRERARSFAHSAPSPLPDGDARYKGCQGRALSAGMLCESRKVRCVAHRHGLLSTAPRERVECRAV